MRQCRKYYNDIHKKSNTHCCALNKKTDIEFVGSGPSLYI